MISFFFIKIGIHPVMYTVYFAPFVAGGFLLYFFSEMSMKVPEAAWAGTGVAVGDLILGFILLSTIGQPKVRTIKPIIRDDDNQDKAPKNQPSSTPSKRFKGARQIAPIQRD